MTMCCPRARELGLLDLVLLLEYGKTPPRCDDTVSEWPEPIGVRADCTERGARAARQIENLRFDRLSV